MRYRVAADLPMDAATYLIDRDTAAFRSLLAKVLDLKCYECVETWQSEGGVVSIKLLAKPEASWVPKQLAAHMPSSFEFYDEVQYRSQDLLEPPYLLHCRTLVPFLGDKAHSHATVRIEDLGPGRCRHVVEGEVKIHMWGLGRVGERLVRKSMEQMFEVLPVVVARWATFRWDLLARPGGGRQLLVGRPDLGHIEWISQECRRLLSLPLMAPVQPVAPQPMPAQRHASSRAGSLQSSSSTMSSSSNREFSTRATNGSVGLAALLPPLAEEQRQQHSQQPLHEHPKGMQPQLSTAGTAYFSPQASLEAGAGGGPLHEPRAASPVELQVHAMNARLAAAAAAAETPPPDLMPPGLASSRQASVKLPTPFGSAFLQQQQLEPIAEVTCVPEHAASQAWLEYWSSDPAVPAMRHPAASAALVRVATLNHRMHSRPHPEGRGKKAARPAYKGQRRGKWWQRCWRPSPQAE